MTLTVAILAGGVSRRMGTDKGALRLGGMTLLERAARAALSAGLPVLVAGRGCPNDWPLDSVDFVPDAVPGRGPLGGLETALGCAASPVLALACDMPLLTGDALRWLADQAASHVGEHGLGIRSRERWEPLFSIYTPASLPLIQTRLTAGRLSLHGLIESGNFGTLDAPAWVAAQLLNVNTPEEWARLVPTDFP